VANKVSLKYIIIGWVLFFCLFFSISLYRDNEMRTAIKKIKTIYNNSAISALTTMRTV